MKTILAPIDFSPVTGKIIEQASQFARALRGRVVLLTALVPPVFVKEFAPPKKNLARVLIGTEKAARRRLTALQDKLLADLVPAESFLLQGEPARLIIEKAEETGASYIVMGSHGHTAFYDLVAGSTTHGVLKRARCPVMVIASHRPSARKATR